MKFMLQIAWLLLGFTLAHSLSISKDVNSVKVQKDVQARPLVKVPDKGGSGGEAFDDFELLRYITGIHSINISYTDQINSIAVTYITVGGQLHSGPLHGKVHGPVVNFTLGPSEHIMLVEGQTNGQYIKQLTFRSIVPGNTKIQYGPYGTEGTTKFSFQKHVVAFHGRSSNFLDSLGVYGLSILNKSLEKGGSGGSPFNDGLPLRLPPVVGMRSISVWNGYVIDGLQIEFLYLGGGTFMGGKHGEGQSNNLTKIALEEGDSLVFVEGSMDTSVSDILVTHLTFTVQKSTGQQMKHGPFGTVKPTSFSFTGKIVGFHGSAGSQIDRIGVFLAND